MTNSFFGGMPQQKGVAPQAAPSGTNSLNSDIDPVKRAKFTGYLEGMSANTVPPQPPQPPMMPPGQGMGMPPMPPMPPQGMQPPMMPQQPPMMMNMGGMVDVFDPMYMNEGGFVISTDDSGKIRTRPVFDEDKGRMVSQIMSRDMVDEMAQAAMAKANQPEPKIEEEIAKFIGYADKPESAIIDDSLKGVPDYTTTTIEPEESIISLPTPKPEIQLPTTKPVIQLPVSKPKFSDIELPVSKPRRDTVGDIDPFSYFDEEGPDQSLTFEKLMKPFVKPKLNVAKLIEGYDDPEELRDAAIYSDIRDIDDLGTVDPRPTVSPEEMDTIARMITEGEKTSGPDVDVFDIIPLIDRFGEMDLVTDEVPKISKLTGLAKLLKFLFPKSGLNEFTASSGQGVDSFNTGGIVQGFFRGGSADRIKSAADNFSSNISGNVSGRDDSDDDLRRDEDISFIDGKEIESTGPVYDAFLKSQESVFAPIVNKIGKSVFGKDPYDLYYTTQQTLKDDSMQSRLARDRLKDQDSAQRKLEEEQRLRDMIAGMMPPTDAITPAPPMVTAPDAPVADPIQPDYSSVVVPSNRVPGFDIGNISPYPQFRMPTEYNPFSSIDSGAMSDELKRLLRESISAPAVPMQQGGAVNQLGSAIDNFLNSYRQ